MPYNDLSSSTSQKFVSGTSMALTVTTNVTTPAAVISASWSATSSTLTVNAVTSGTLAIGQTISGPGITPGTKITSLSVGVEYNTTYPGPFDTLISTIPFAIYRAKDYNGATHTLREARGNGWDATTSGNIQTGYGNGNGAAASLHSMCGSTSATVQWPAFPMLSYSLCSITRYSSLTSMQRILSSINTDNSFVHGHSGGNRGYAYYGGSTVYAGFSTGTKTDWVVLCGSTGTDTPNNILVNGIAS